MNTLTINNFEIRMNENGLFSFNDLHKASGGAAKHQPHRFLRLNATKALIEEIGACSEMSTPSPRLTMASITAHMLVENW